jgi:hypothetical protein
MVLCQHELRALHDSGSPAADALALLATYIPNYLKLSAGSVPTARTPECGRLATTTDARLYRRCRWRPGCMSTYGIQTQRIRMNNPCELDVITTPGGSRKTDARRRGGSYRRGQPARG